MRQIIQDLKSGNTLLAEVPAPQVKNGYVLIKTAKTLVSLGTERMLVEFGKASYLEKARQQPDKVKQVLDKIKTDGLKPTVEAVFNKLGQPLPLGYCNVGEVVAIGKGVEEFKVGDRVASNGHHAEYVCVPKNLVAKIPDRVSDEQATFTVIGSIALQGIRLAKPTFGETVVVIGLGLIGLVTVQLLKANGCRVIGFDFDEQKVALAKKWDIEAYNPKEGAEQIKTVLDATNGIGADNVIITASSKSNEIIHQAAEMSRKLGRITLVGVIGLQIRRADFYKKELSFQVSCSYGPGRYDSEYEEKGNDYPLPYVRWTEKRNFQAILEALAKKQLNVDELISERVELKNYQEIYGDMRKSGSIASILSFPEQKEKISHTISFNTAKKESSKGVIAIIGSGNFTSSTIMPQLKKLKANIKYICSAGGLSAANLAKKYDVEKASTNFHEVLEDETVDLVLITTRHNLHAPMILQALAAGKHVFVEKPLALTQEELQEIDEKVRISGKSVTVGFNRRFAPLAVKMKKLAGSSPKNIVATMNAGFIPPEVWVHDMQIGGGRIIGEACHYMDLCNFLIDSKIKSVCMNALGKNPKENTDNASILLKYEDGSNAVINYFANGSKAYSKERIEVFSQEKTFILDNWRSLKTYGIKGFSGKKSGQDKGHNAQFDLLNQWLKNGGDPLIPHSQIMNASKAAVAAILSLKSGSWVNIVE